MTITQDLQHYFGADASARLGAAAGLGPQAAADVLSEGLARQLAALAAHAATPQGRSQVQEAVDNLPVFGPVTEVLAEPDGATHLEQAGALLAPVLLGGAAPEGQSGEARLLHLALPLLLSRLGQQDDLGRALAGAGGQPLDLQPPDPGQAGIGAAAAGQSGAAAIRAGAGLEPGGVGLLAADRTPPAASLKVGSEAAIPAATPVSTVSVPGLDSLPGEEGAAPPSTVVLGKTQAGTQGRLAAATPPGAAVLGAGALGSAGLSSTGLGSAGLLDFVRAQLGGKVAEQLGRAAGFSAGTSGRAVAGALPVVLNAGVNKGGAESGAAELLRQGEGFGRWTRPDGSLDAALLADPAETARLEGQGRGLLGGLFGNFEAMTGRLGTALGGSGASAGRLLALLTPLVLALIARHAQARSLNAAGLSTELAALGPQLPGLLPSGMDGLKALLGAGTVAGVAVAGAGAARAAAPEVVASAAPAVRTVTPPRPPVVSTPPAPPASAPAGAAPRRGFPWWLIPLLLLLLLGGCWLVNRNPAPGTGTATTGTAAGTGIVVTTPQAGADLPAQAFTMSGTAPAGTSLRIEDQGQEVGTATADPTGNWSAELPAPTPGEHTYSVIGGEGVRSEFKVNVTDAAGTGTTSTGTTGTGTGGTDTVSPDASGAATSGTDAGSTDTGTAPTGTDTAGSADLAAPATGASDTGAAATGAAGTAVGTAAFSQPASGAEVAASGLSLSGTGPTGQSYEVLEDGTSIGNVTVGEDGNWTLAVPGATAGAKTYVLRGADGQEVASLPLTVTAGAGAAAGAACTEALTVSLKDGERVSAPYRFGGVGGGSGYTVTVKRGERVIGTRNVALGEGCAWSYTSNPGGRAGSENRITYEVRPSGTDAAQPAEATLTLTVRN